MALSPAIVDCITLPARKVVMLVVLFPRVVTTKAGDLSPTQGVLEELTHTSPVQTL